jgi:hypothetical protein
MGRLTLDKESSMHFRSWLFLTAMTLLLTGFAVSRAGWLDERTSAPNHRGVARVHASAQDLFASESGSRFRTGEPRHWKYLMLKH